MQEDELGVFRRQAALSSGNIAEVILKAHRFKGAVKHFQKSFDAFSFTYGEDHEDTKAMADWVRTAQSKHRWALVKRAIKDTVRFDATLQAALAAVDAAIDAAEHAATLVEHMEDVCSASVIVVDHTGIIGSNMPHNTAQSKHRWVLVKGAIKDTVRFDAFESLSFSFPVALHAAKCSSSSGSGAGSGSTENKSQEEEQRLKQEERSKKKEEER